MQQKISSSKPRRFGKFSFALATIALLIGGFFIYKYSYIYLERKKYDQAATVLHKVAYDLRTQGINTEFSRGCQRAEGVFGPGAMSCSVSIIRKSIYSEESVRNNITYFSNSAEKEGFTLQNENGLDINENPVRTSTSTYSLKNLPMQCRFRYSRSGQDDNTVNISLSCGSNSSFSLF